MVSRSRDSGRLTTAGLLRKEVIGQISLQNTLRAGKRSRETRSLRTALRTTFDCGLPPANPTRGFDFAPLSRALHKDEAGRRISDPEAGPLFVREEQSPFAGQLDDDDFASGTIYVLRSKSDHPVVAANRDVLHKIGVTGGDVQKRIANAKFDPTFLMAEAEIVATYTLYNINRTKLENLIHRIFDPARLDIEIKDRFGNPVIPREWFLVPRFIVDDAVERIKDGTITEYTYDPKTARLVRSGAGKSNPEVSVG